MPQRANALELWGGLECTINRAHDVWFDQMKRTGHLDRRGDLALFRELGLKKLRYGLQWERFTAAGTLAIFDAKLNEMRDLGIEPIAGLLHHGSGPAGTSLMDPQFGEKLAEYALQLAGRYPWIQSYTPVNEPHTTARFSGLYGHWYPHHRSFGSYLRMLVNQLRASVLAMQAVRRVRSDAIFVHTEDGGKTWSTEALAEICAVREGRRWLGLDLLCGRVDEFHPMYGYLLSHGLTEREILWFAENPCPPDVVGLNYYLTSDRFLDDQTDRYPESLRGGDTGDEPLVDIEAVRVCGQGIAGVGSLLTEAWERYRIPVAITEAHLGGSVEDQVRWLVGIWNEAKAVREAGVDCVAVTVWALLGSFDWNSLVTRDDGVYEPGVFDVRDGRPVATDLVPVVQGLAQGQPFAEVAGGWWTQPERLTFEPVDRA